MFITFEGIDACGKSTQIELIEHVLKEKEIDYMVTRQPGGTQIGQLIRNILLNPDHINMVPEAEVLLYMADRVQHIKEVIQPALDAGKVVLCDRYHEATLAYQGGGRQLDLRWLKAIEKKFVVTPDLSFWFDISVETSQERLKKRNQMLGVENCRFEREDEAFFIRTIKKYKHFNALHPDRFIRISGDGTRSEITEKVLNLFLPALEEKMKQ